MCTFLFLTVHRESGKYISCKTGIEKCRADTISTIVLHTYIAGQRQMCGNSIFNVAASFEGYRLIGFNFLCRIVSEYKSPNTISHRTRFTKIFVGGGGSGLGVLAECCTRFARSREIQSNLSAYGILLNTICRRTMRT
jgi:hypothetical protein